jgi:hypothetical protein
MDAKQCPWCQRWAIKDDNCNYIFACGLDENGVFQKGLGCGRSWCFKCGLKFCGIYYLPDGYKNSNAIDVHGDCCTKEKGFEQKNYCPGGHNSHCSQRW